MSHLFTIVKSMKGLQFHRLSAFPQNLVEYAVVARKNGMHPQNFTPDFESPYHRVSCSLRRRFSAITNVPVTPNKLLFPGKKSVVRVEEKNVNLLTEILTTFCPEDGSVLDAFAGTMSTALACLETNRSCVCTEMDSECFRPAHERLRAKALSMDISVSFVKQPGRWTLTKRQKINDSTKSATDEIQRQLTNESSVPAKPMDLSSISKEECAYEHLRTGDDAELLIEGKVVGLAQVALPAPDEKQSVSRILHSTKPAELSQNGEYLLVVWRLRINPECVNISFPILHPVPMKK